MVRLLGSPVMYLLITTGDGQYVVKGSSALYHRIDRDWLEGAESTCTQL